MVKTIVVRREDTDRLLRIQRLKALITKDIVGISGLKTFRIVPPKYYKSKQVITDNKQLVTLVHTIDHPIVKQECDTNLQEHSKDPLLSSP
jgi:hypothetical protein